MRYDHYNTAGEFVSGPHELFSAYVKKITGCGNPDLLDLPLYGLREHVEPVQPTVVTDYTESNKAQLWEAAHQWEYQRISGAALSLLALGVAQGKPKCTAVAAWLKTLWDDNYYPRKALITNAEISATALDFGNVGEMPYTVQEMSAEIYQ